MRYFTLAAKRCAQSWRPCVFGVPERPVRGKIHDMRNRLQRVGLWLAPVLLGAGLLLAGPALAAPEAPGDDLLRVRVQDFLDAANAGVGERIEVAVTAPGANLAACSDPQPFWPTPGVRSWGRVTVGVRCPGDAPELRYVQAEVRVFGSYFVAVRDIATGDLLAGGDLALREGEITREQGRLPEGDKAIVGQQARRRIGEGQIIMASMLKAPDIVTRGERVTVLVQGAGFAVKSAGQALDSGGQGAAVRVRTAAGKVITGTPREPGVVVIP